MSEIRSLLANAQAAEVRGDKAEAGRILREAASYYRERQQLTQAARMLRQARKAEGLPEEPEEDESVFGFEAPDRVLVEQRTPQLADPSVDAWCSFCCKPKSEVGALVAGPAGSFICAGCTEISTKLNGAQNETPSPVERERVGVRAEWSITKLTHELPAQQRATQRLTRLRSSFTLVIGPAGSGKSAWLKTLGEIEVIDAALTPTLSRDRERGSSSAPTFIVITAEVPPAALILQGEFGPEPLHDTSSLTKALPKIDAQLLAKVDAVFSFEAPDVDALIGLSRALAKERSIIISDEVLTQVAQLAHRSGRGAHELVALLARIPSGNYT